MDISRRAAVTQIALGTGLLATAAAAQKSRLVVTPFETAGPFYPSLKPPDLDADLTLVRGRSGHARGTVIEIAGRVLTSRGEPVPGARIELWQANAAGRYAHASDPNTAPLDPDFQGYGDLRTDRQGHFRVLTIKPGAYPIGPGVLRTPHIHFEVAGQQDRLTTQMYFPGEPLNANDILVRQMGDPSALIAKAVAPSAQGIERFDWDVVLISG